MLTRYKRFNNNSARCTGQDTLTDPLRPGTDDTSHLALKSCTYFTLLLTAIAILIGCTPDLTIKKVRTQWDRGHKIVQVDVANARAPTGKPTTLCVEPSGGTPRNGVVTKTEAVPSLKAGGVHSLTLDFAELANPENGCLEGFTTATVTLDPENQIKESNERNNSAIVSLAPSEPPVVNGAKLALKVIPYPEPATESSVISLRFLITVQPAESGDVDLAELQYELFNGKESSPFFKDELALYGRNAPGGVDVMPGIEYPDSGTPTRVIAKLLYIADGQIEITQQESTIKPALISGSPASRMYSRYHDGFLRRHLVASGRELGKAWLKEYEPGKDRQELLWHSRTFTVNGRTRVYVPWTYTCEGAECGTSVHDGATVPYGGDENPLLRGGLALAVLSREYIATGKTRTLRRATDIFEYIERSEWKDPNQQNVPTGFFLRSSRPGHNESHSGRESIFASVDELAGMSLGLLHFNRALIKAGPSFSPLRSRLIKLVDRMATQLARNYYFIVPVSFSSSDGTWHDIGLPHELQRGWAGSFFLQWFFARGFRAITGHDYTVPNYSHVLDLMSYIQAFKDISGEDYNRMSSLLIAMFPKEIPSPFRLAIGSIQALGVAMYYEKKTWTVPLPCWPDDLTVPVPAIERWNFPMLLHVYQFAMGDEQIPSSERDQIRTEMAHLINGVLSEGHVTTHIDLEILIDSGVTLFGSYNPFVQLMHLITHFCTDKPAEYVGTAQAEDDAYAAMIAMADDLPIQYEKRKEREKFRANIRRAVQGTIGRFAKGLPVGERFDCWACLGSGPVLSSQPLRRCLPPRRRNQCPRGDVCTPVVPVHNPQEDLGCQFAWESRPDDRLCPATGKDDQGLADSLITEMCYQPARGLDSMMEGAGLDFLMPMSQVLDMSSMSRELLQSSNPTLRLKGQRMRTDLTDVLGKSADFQNLKPLTPDWVPLLPICASDPVTAASSQGDYYYQPCSLNFPKLYADEFDSGPRNDQLRNARPIETWGKALVLTLDREPPRSISISSTAGNYRYPEMGTYHSGSAPEHLFGGQVDHDFFTFESKFPTEIAVSHSATQPIHVFVDGKPRATAVTALETGRQHTIMVTGSMQEYQLTITPTWTRLAGVLTLKDGMLEADLSRARTGYEGKLLLRSGTTELLATQVLRISGDDHSTVFDGNGELNGNSGFTFHLSVSDVCPRGMTVEIKGADGTIAFATAEEIKSGVFQSGQ